MLFKLYIMKVAFWCILHYDIEIALISEKFEQFDDVGMVKFTKDRYL